MKSEIPSCLAAALICAWSVGVGAAAEPADLSELFAAAARYESGGSTLPLRQIEQLVSRSVSEPALRDQLDAALGRLIATEASYEAKRFACEQLAIIGPDQSLSALAGLLQRDETVGIACLALAGHPSAKADSALREALPRLRGLAAAQVISALADRRDSRAVGELSRLARAPDRAVAEAAIAALGKIADKPSCATLAALRRQANSLNAAAVWEASLRAAERVAARGERAAAGAIYGELLQPAHPLAVRRGAFAGLLRLDRDGGGDRLVKTLRGSDPTLKPDAIAAVAALRSPDASERFARELPRLTPNERVLLIQALAIRGDPAARVAVSAEVASPEADVREAAVTALGQLGDAMSVPLLAKALATTPTPRERSVIEQTLVVLNGHEATDSAILAELKAAPADAQRSLIAVLARRHSRAAIPALFSATTNASPVVVKAAYQALARLATGREVPALLDRVLNLQDAAARGDAEDALRQALLQVEDLTRRSSLVCDKLGEAREIESRCSLLRVLPAAADRRSLAALQQAAGDPEPRVGDAAIRTLADWPDIAAWDTLVGVYRQPQSETHRALALRGLVRLAGEADAQAGALERCRQLLDGAKQDDDRKLVLGVIGGSTDPQALQLVLPLLSDPGVRAEAEQAVKRIAESIKQKHPQAAQEALKRLSETK